MLILRLLLAVIDVIKGVKIGLSALLLILWLAINIDFVALSLASKTKS
jgi:hypothetical protein